MVIRQTVESHSTNNPVVQASGTDLKIQLQSPPQKAQWHPPVAGMADFATAEPPYTLYPCHVIQMCVRMKKVDRLLGNLSYGDAFLKVCGP
jgi:hypothetical protein